jgi:hypothetical protein bfra3_13720
MANISSYQRLKEVLDKYLKEDFRRSTTSFEREFGLPNAFFQNAEKRDKPNDQKRLYRVTYENIHNAQPLLNIEWLKTGEGEMWLHDETENAIEVSRVGRPYYNVDFLGGFDLMVNEQTTVPVSYISMEPYNKDGYYWCNLTGDSMSPLIKSGAKICLKYIEDGVNGIIYGDVYALVTKSDMRTVKWVVRSNDENKIRLVPENKDSKYGDFQDIWKSDIIKVFKVELTVNPL